MLMNPASLHSEEEKAYYIRSDHKTRNGELTEGTLLMLPAEDDYRMSHFKSYTITGHAKVSSKPDPFSAAKHNALDGLLVSEGVVSIRNKTTSDKTKPYEESILSYEGYIKTPYKIIRQDYIDNNEILEIEIAVFFAPITYPPEWSFHKFKKKLYDMIHNMVSVFQ